MLVASVFRTGKGVRRLYATLSVVPKSTSRKSGSHSSHSGQPLACKRDRGVATLLLLLSCQSTLILQHICFEINKSIKGGFCPADTNKRPSDKQHTYNK